ncbi:MAG: RNA methyltransferase PUA domain-containing protein, partial [Candidatus Methylomirabilales bacterium]
MRVPMVFLPGAAPGVSIEASGGAYEHLIRVLRREPGDPLVALDGRGGAFDARIERIDAAGGRIRVQVGAAVPRPPPGTAPLAVALGLPRGDGFEAAVRWGSEMGLARLLPL